MTLANLKPGFSGRVTRIGAKGPLKRRLMDMGLVSGAEVKVETIAPLGDPIEIRIKQYRLSLRRGEADNIEVEALP